MKINTRIIEGFADWWARRKTYLRWCPIAPVDSPIALTTATRLSSMPGEYNFRISPSPCSYTKPVMVLTGVNNMAPARAPGVLSTRSKFPHGTV